MSTIKISGLSKRFGRHTALDGFNLTIDSREHLAILGPSGAGKSTLLRVIAGLERPDEGELWIGGRAANELAPDRRGLAYMSQDYALYPQLSVLQNLQSALWSLKLSSAERDARCRESLVWFGIEAVAGQLPAQLSGGQAQRVALAKALIRRPQWLLLDEPFSQLDCRLRDELRDLLAKVCEHYQTCLIFVTHDPLDALRMAKQLALLVDGKLVQCDAPLQVYRAPAGRLAAELVSPWGIHWLSPQGFASGTFSGAQAGGDALRAELARGAELGFRPEDAQLHTAASLLEKTARAETVWSMPVRVERVQSLGFAQLVFVQTPADRYSCLLPVAAVVPDSPQLVVAAESLLHCGIGQRSVPSVAREN